MNTAHGYTSKVQREDCLFRTVWRATVYYRNRQWWTCLYSTNSSASFAAQSVTRRLNSERRALTARAPWWGRPPRS